MSAARYQVGDGTGLAGTDAVALVAGQPDSVLVRAVERSLGLGEDLAGAAQRLLALGLDALGTFAWAFVDDEGLRVLARGAVVVSVETPAGTATILGRSTSTWHEEIVPGAKRVTLSFAGSPMADDLPFALGGGTAPACAIRLDLAPGNPMTEDSKARPDPTPTLEPRSPHPSPEPEARGPDPEPGPDLETEPDPDPEPPAVNDGSVWPPPPPPPGSVLDEEFGELLGATRNWRAGPPAARPAPVDPTAPNPTAPIPNVPGPGSAGHEQPTSATAHLPPPPPGPRIISSVPGWASGREPAQPAPVAAPAPDPSDDHATVARPRSRASVDSDPARPTVASVHCPAGHPNPPHVQACRVCSGDITDRTVQVIPRPSMGVLEFSDGTCSALLSPVVLGRRPLDGLVLDGETATAVALADPARVLSRSHAEVRIAGWQVQVVDRDSMNGTFLLLPGRPAFRLHPGEPYPLPPGATVSLGEEVSFRFVADDPAPSPGGLGA